MKNGSLEQQIEDQLKRFEQAVVFPQNQKTNENRIFVCDGIIDFEKYLKAPIKILFILKEANSEFDDLPDMQSNLASLIDEKTNRIHADWGKTWRPIAYCAYGIFEGKNYEHIRTNDSEVEIVKHMKNIAHINLKKYAGGSKAQKVELQNFYNKYKELLHEQIKIINPDVLIFCGTYDFFDEEQLRLQFGDQLIVERKSNEPNYFEKYEYENALLIKTYHPNAYVDKEIYCNSIIDTIRDWKQKVKK